MAAAKRIWDESSSSDRNPDRSASDDRGIKRRPSLQKVVELAILANRPQDLVFALEPFLRSVVQEETERIVSSRLLGRPHERPLGMRIEASAATGDQLSSSPSSFKLIFRRPPSLPIFTLTRIEDIDSNPLQLLLVATDSAGTSASSSHNRPATLKIELVALEGDFAGDEVGEDLNWTSKEFQSKIVKERAGKQPLLVGDVCVTLRDGSAVVSNLSFSDNSHWGKSGRFRIGARVVPASYDGPRIREAITMSFKVKDHRGEAYKKHHPPVLTDQVWRLEKIGKDGKFHEKLASENINTVQDFLKLLFADQHRLRRILGPGMSDRTWKVTTNHAKTCVVGDQLYVHRGHPFSIAVNSVCQVMGVIHAGTDTLVSPQDLTEHGVDHIKKLAREAYRNWDYLEDACRG